LLVFNKNLLILVALTRATLRMLDKHFFFERLSLDVLEVFMEYLCRFYSIIQTTYDAWKIK